MKKTLCQIIESYTDKYGVLGEVFPSLLTESPNIKLDCSKLNELEDGYAKGVLLDKKDDFYLGKIMYCNKLLGALSKKIEINDKILQDANKAAERTKAILVLYNQGLAIKIASMYTGLGIEKEDLIQEGIMKLMIAAEKYDYRKGYKFVTYATYWVKQGMSESIHNQSKMIRRPTHIIAILNKINSAKEKLRDEFDRDATIEEISLETDIPIEELDKYMTYSQDVVSFQALNPDNEDCTFENLITSGVSVEDIICDKSIKDAVQKAMSSLTQREIDILTLRYGLNNEEPMTLEQVGDRLGITRERVRQIESKALRNLRHPSRSKYFKDYI